MGFGALSYAGVVHERMGPRYYHGLHVQVDGGPAVESQLPAEVGGGALASYVRCRQCGRRFSILQTAHSEERRREPISS